MVRLKLREGVAFGPKYAIGANFGMIGHLHGVLMIDARGMHMDIVSAICTKEADYLLPVKENQRNLHKDLCLFTEKDEHPMEKADMRMKCMYVWDMQP